MRNTTHAPVVWLAATMLLAATAAPVSSRSVRKPDEPAPRPAPAAARASALRFEANVGQTDGRAGFVARGPGYTLFLTPTEAVMAIGVARGRDDACRCAAAPATSGEEVVRLGLAGASPSAGGVGEGRLSGRTSYLVGRDASNWRRDVPAFERVRYTGVYPGVDVVYYGADGGALEYDFVVAPGADPARVRLRVGGGTGMRGVRLDGGGDLLIATGHGELRQRRPVLYQTIGGARRDVPGGFELNDDGTVGFRIGAYDRSRPLTIDPVLSYATLLGGSASDDSTSVAVDAAGGIYVLGTTRAADFPSVVDLPGTVRGGVEIFVAKLDPSGTSLQYSVFVGGSGDEYSSSIRVDGSGNAVVRGFTVSTDFPTVDAAQVALGGDRDTVVFKINAAGTGFVYSTYLGGSGDEFCFTGLDVDAAGNAYVSGCTTSPDLPTLNALDPTLDGDSDGYVVKYGPTGQRVYATYIGGSTAGEAIYEVAALPNGALILSGTTFATDFPTVNPLQAANAGGFDGVVARLSPSGRTLEFSTYLGGSGDDLPGRVAVDAVGNVYLALITTSADYPTVRAFQTSYGGGPRDGAVTKISADGRAIVFSSYLGGSGDDEALGVSVDGRGATYVTGDTESTDFPTRDAIQSTSGGGRDLFAARVAPNGSELEYSTYLGGSRRELSNHSTIDADGNLYVSFSSQSSDFPLVNPFQGTLNGADDAGVAKISDLYELRWDAPASDGAAPRNAEAVLAEGGGSAPGATSDAREVRALIGYKVYRSTARSVSTTPDNLFTTLPANQTTTGPTAPGGSFFVVTACYDDGSESGPSNEAGAGTGDGADLGKVRVKTTKITAKGDGFSSTVQVFLDGIPFVAPAAVKNGKKVVQSGTLLTGETIGQYLAAHDDRALVTFRNSNGTLATFAYRR